MLPRGENKKNIVNTFSGGINKDVSVLGVKPNQYRHAKNVVPSTTDGDFFDLTSEKGNAVIDNIPSGYKIIGHSVLEDEIIIFSTDETNHEIGILDGSDTYTTIVNNNGTTTTIPSDSYADTTNLSFSIDNPIKAVSRKLFNNERIVYWTDNNKPPRVLNLDSPPTSSLAESSELFGNQKLPLVEYRETLEAGNLEVGVYQFACRYLNENLDPIYIGLISSPIPVVEDLRIEGRIGYDGAIKGTNASKSIVLDVSNIDTDYAFIELIAISYTGPSDTIQAVVTQRKEIIAENMSFTYSDKDTFIEEISIDEVSIMQPSYKTAKCIEQKDGHLLLSNLTSSQQALFQSLANKISMKYEVRQIDYVDTEDLTVSTPGTGFTFVSAYVNVDSDGGEDTLIFEFTEDVAITSTKDQFALVRVAYTAGTPNTFTNTRIEPDIIQVVDNKVYAQFTGQDLTDETTYNLDSFSEIDTVPLYTYGFGSDLDAISGSGTSDVADEAATTTLTETGPIHSKQATASSATDVTTAIRVVFSSTPSPELSVGESFAMYGDVHTSIDFGTFTITNKVAGDTYDVTSNTTGNETDTPAPIIIADTADIAIRQELAVTEDIENIENNSYFEDYINEANSFYYKGYKRDEVYSMGIQFIFDNGARSPVFHIPGKDRTTVYSGTPDNNRLAADTINEFMGTYISEETYPTSGGYPSDAGSGDDHSDGGNIRHHKIPSMDDVPIVERTGGELKINIIGMKPVWMDGVTEKTLAQLIASDAEAASQISGFVIMRQKRDVSANRHIVMQGVAQKLFKHGGGGVNSDSDNNAAYLSNSYLFGKTRIEANTRVYPRHDNKTSHGFQTFGYRGPTDTDYQDPHSTSETVALASFYSPDNILLDRQVPTGAKVKPVAVIEGAIRATAEVPAFATKNDDRRSGGLHVFCSYNDLSTTLTNVLPSTNPTVVNSFQTNYAAETQSSFLTPVPDRSSLTKICNYINEGFLCLDLGSNSLPDEQISSPEISWKMSMSRDTATNFTETNQAFYLNGGKSERCLYDIVTDNIRQYGSLDSSEFIPAAAFTDLSAISTTDDTISYGGDTFISKFAFKNSNNFRWRLAWGDNVTNSSKVENMNNARSGNPSSEDGDELRALAYFFVESEVNCNYRHREQDANGNQGVAYYPNTPVISQTEEPFIWSSPFVGDIVFTRRFKVDGTGVLDYNPSLGESQGYNELYSKDNEIGVQASLPFTFQEVTEFRNRTIYSQKTIEGSQSDNYRFFLANDFHDVPKHSGEIWNTFVINDTFWIQTKQSLWRTYVNEKTVQATSSGDVTLGTGGLFPIPSKEVFTASGGYAGTQSQWGGVNTPYGRFFVDYNQRKIFWLKGEQVDELPGSISRYLQTNIPVSGTHNDNPFDNTSTGLRMYYDYELDRLLLTKVDGVNSLTLSWSPKSQNWISEHSYYPSAFMTVGTRNYSMYNDTGVGGSNIWKHGTGNYGSYYGTVSNFEIDFICNGDPMMSKVFDNLVVESTSYNEAASVVVHKDFFDTIQVLNEHSNTGTISLTISTPRDTTDNVRYRKDGFQLAIPRNAVVDPTINVESGGNLNQAQTFKPRMKGKHFVVKLVYNNSNNYKFNLESIICLYRLLHE